MPSALEDYMTRMGLGSSATGSLGLDVPPPREVPKFTKFGDRMAALGGFGDQPGELKTLEELQKMSQEEIDKYKKDRAKARGQGIAETLIRIGEAFQGKPASANALARQQQRQIIESQNLARQKFNEAYATANPSMRKLMDAFRGNESTWYEASKTYSAKKLFGEEKDRKVVQDAEGYYRYVDTGERVFPGVVKPEKEKTISDYVADIAKKVQEDPNYQLSDQDKRILGISRKASESAMMLEELQAQALKDINLKDNLSLPTYPSLQAAINAGLKPGDQFKGTDGVTYKIP